MKLKEAIEDKKNNIGSLVLYLKKRPELIEELETYFNFGDSHTYSLVEKIRCYLYNDFTEKNCSCGERLKWKDFKNGWRKTCGKKECIDKKTEETNIDRFGYKNPMQNKDILYKNIETNLKKYGVKNPTQNSIIKNKIVETNIKKYTYASPMQRKEIRDKVINSWISKSFKEKEDINKKRLETFFNKTEEEKYLIKEKRKKTLMKRFGVEHTFESSIIREKIKSTNLQRYGVEICLNNKDIKNKAIESYRETHISNIKEKLIENGHGWEYVSHYLNNNNNIIYELEKDGKKINISIGNLKFKLKNGYDLEPLNGISNLENSVLNYIKSIYSGEISKYRDGNLEIDIYIPELKVGFEVNGLYWHSEIYKNKNYHLNKSNICKEKGIKLIHLWEDDLYEKREIIESRIANILNKSNKIWARKCKFHIIPHKEASEFLDANHLQGGVVSKYYYGLKYEDELVSLMSFGKKRKFMNSDDVEGEFELYRFCNKNGYNVIGGASLMLKKFIQNIKPILLISYADKCWGDSTLYSTLGFEYEKDTEVGYYWCINEKRYHRYKFRKQNLIKDGYDPNKTEIEIMHERGYYRIWDCGNEKWFYKL